MALSEILPMNPPRDAESQARLTRIREQWVQDVTALVQQVTDWALAAKASQEWEIETGSLDIYEEAIGGSYTVPMLKIHAGDDDLHLEPVGRRVLRADGRVDLYAYPSHYRVMLLRRNGAWIVRTESGLDWPQAWSEKTFLTLAVGLLKAE